MKKQEEKDVVINIPVRLKYYLDPIAIILGAIIVSSVIIYIGISLR